MGIRLNFIVEGQTEEAFVKRILNPHLANLGVYVKVRCVLTSWKNNIKHRGGIENYEKVKNDINAWIKEDRKSDVRFTTIAILNHLRAKVYWLNLGNWKYFFCRIPLTNRFLICSKQVVHIAWVRTKVLPFNQMSSTGFSCGV